MKAYPSSNESIPTGFYTRNESIPQNKSHILELKENHMCHFFEIETVGKVLLFTFCQLLFRRL